MINQIEINELRECQERNYPLLTNNDLIKKTIREKIQHQIHKPSRIGPFRKNLFSLFDGGNSYLSDTKNKEVGRIENDLLQKLGVDVMKEYGLNENIYDMTRNKKYPTLIIEKYPSQTPKGIFFERVRNYTGNKLNGVTWSIINRRSHLLTAFDTLFK